MLDCLRLRELRQKTHHLLFEFTRVWWWLPLRCAAGGEDFARRLVVLSALAVGRSGIPAFFPPTRITGTLKPTCSLSIDRAVSFD